MVCQSKNHITVHTSVAVLVRYRRKFETEGRERLIEEGGGGGKRKVGNLQSQGVLRQQLGKRETGYEEGDI